MAIKKDALASVKSAATAVVAFGALLDALADNHTISADVAGIIKRELASLDVSEPPTKPTKK